MKKLAPIAALAVLFVCTHAGNECVQETVILTGEYVWDDKKGDLKAVFVETGEGGWDVRFHYTWDDQASIWEGTARGGLSEGVMYAILLMNALVPFINRATQPRKFGTVQVGSGS